MDLILTVDEIIATLQRSNLTTVLVEGVEDVMIYRWLEDEIGIHNANFMPCNGRNNLIEIFERRNEFLEARVVFVADKDSYIFTGVPSKYEDIVWTNGYSIENDLYFGRNIEKILSDAERHIFTKSLNSFVIYYAFEVEKLIGGSAYTLTEHPQAVICEKQHEVKQEFLDDIKFVPPSEEIVNQILENYDVMLRGKSLFALLTRIVSGHKRKIKHSKSSLLEHCYRTHKSEKFVELMEKIHVKVAI